MGKYTKKIFNRRFLKEDNERKQRILEECKRKAHQQWRARLIINAMLRKMKRTDIELCEILNVPIGLESTNYTESNDFQIGWKLR